MARLTQNIALLDKKGPLPKLTVDWAAIRRDFILSERLRILDLFNQLTAPGGMTQEKAAKVLGKSKSTILRWRKDPIPKSTRPHNVRTKKDQKRYKMLKDQVYALRLLHKTWGRKKIHYEMTKVLRFKISVSMVGRMIQELIKCGQISSYFGRFTRERRASHPPREHAIPRPKGLKASKPGEIVQIDTMYIPADNSRGYLFQVNATCCYSKWSCGMVFRSASAANATKLLKKLLKTAPFKIEAIQTDQGSEFRGKFERVCEANQLTFYVNHPHSPKQNAVVERLNRTVREDFYSVKSYPSGNLAVLNRMVNKYFEFYNKRRPHQSLGNIPPMKFLKQHKKYST